MHALQKDTDYQATPEADKAAFRTEEPPHPRRGRGPYLAYISPDDNEAFRELLRRGRQLLAECSGAATSPL
jgi:hypothetical protein